MPTYELLFAYACSITLAGIVIISELIYANKKKDKTINELTEIIKIGK